MTEEQLQEVQRQMAARMANATDVRLVRGGALPFEVAEGEEPKMDPIYRLEWNWRDAPAEEPVWASFTARHCPDTTDDLVTYLCDMLEAGNPHLPPSARLEIVGLPTEVTSG